MNSMINHFFTYSSDWTDFSKSNQSFKIELAYELHNWVARSRVTVSIDVPESRNKV